MRNPIQVTEVSRGARGYRRPKHSWNVSPMPWAIQPIAIAPVIPGETLKNLVWQARAVTDPIKAGITGWWLEYYWFYVKLSDLDEREEFMEMVINPEWSPAAVVSSTASGATMFGGKSQINWVEKCLNRVVDTYFRNEGETHADYRFAAPVPGTTTGSLPVASFAHPHWTDSLISAANYAAPDVDIVVGADDTITASEIETALRQYELLRMNGLVDMTYEDFLRTYGIRGTVAAAAEDPRIPELLRYTREWQYPSNTVLADTSVNAAVSWGIAERADKDRFFAEPGFIVGYTVARPKVVFGNIDTAGASLLDRIQTWLPAVLWDDPFTSIVEKAQNGGPISGAPAGAYVLDVRDLFLHGDHFKGFSGNTSANFNLVPIPASADLRHRYPIQTDVDNLYPASAANKFVRQDGVADFTIASHTKQDYTAGTASRNG